MSNLLPATEKRAILRLYRKRFMSLAFFAVMVLMVISAVLLFPALYSLKSEEGSLAEKRDALATGDTSQIATTLASTISDINTRLAVFPDTAVSSPVVSGMIDPILKLKTAAVHISNFSYSKGTKTIPGTVEISGTTDSRADLLNFADQMKTIGKFTNVDVPIQSFIKDSNVTFTITASVAPQK